MLFPCAYLLRRKLILTHSRFILRDFTYDESTIEKQRKDFQFAGVEERELWVRLFLFSRPPFFSSFLCTSTNSFTLGP